MFLGGCVIYCEIRYIRIDFVMLVKVYKNNFYNYNKFSKENIVCLWENDFNINFLNVIY